MQRKTSRRLFLAASAFSAARARPVLGANDRVRVGVIGTGSRGKYLMKRTAETDQVAWVAVCDIYDKRRAEAVELAGSRVESYLDYRQLLERNDIDAVIIATPDHWHAQMTVDACRAGKDVYVEKPMTAKPKEGLAVVKAAREHKRIVQVGVQQRSGPHYLEVKEKVIDPGLLGKVGLVRTWYNSNRGYLYKPPPGMEKKPSGLNWQRYLGPLKKIPWDPKRYFNRFAYWDISTGGQIGGLYVHLIDTVHWYLNIDKPSATVAGGGIYEFPDGRDSPDVINMIAEYPEKLNATFEAEVLTAGITNEVPTAGMEFHGAGGILTVYRDKWKYGYCYVPNPKHSKAAAITGPHFTADAKPHIENWLECIRTRQRPRADEVSGHYSAVACHMGMMAYRQRKRIRWNRNWEV